MVQEISPSISKGQSAGSNKLRRIANEWTKALSVVERGRQSLDHVGIGRRNAETRRNASVVSQRNAGIAGAIDHGEGRTGLIQRHTRDLPSTENRVRESGAAVWGWGSVPLGRRRIRRVRFPHSLSKPVRQIW